MSKLLRLAAIAAAYVLASVVAGAVSLIGILFATAGFRVFLPGALAQMSVPILFASLIAAATALLPTLPVGIYAERQRKRALGWYAWAGGGVGLAALLLYVVASEVVAGSISNANAEDAKFLLALAGSVACAGVCAGTTYWAVAGRRAGWPTNTPTTR